MSESERGRKLPYEPTPDVEETIGWLTSNDFVLAESNGPEGMGHQWLVFERPDGARVRLGTERSQWMADLSFPTWDRWFDLDIIAQAMAGEAQAKTSIGSGMPAQLPPGVQWRRAVPDALSWVTATPDAASLLEGLQRERASRLFPPHRPD